MATNRTSHQRIYMEGREHGVLDSDQDNPDRLIVRGSPRQGYPWPVEGKASRHPDMSSCDDRYSLRPATCDRCAAYDCVTHQLPKRFVFHLKRHSQTAIRIIFEGVENLEPGPDGKTSLWRCRQQQPRDSGA
ncbi:hypothetical protein E4U54_001170 [Claviceps lovelessii]|nr:hypothetical protein E4U54_001170 [Claviceps lovelessii]